MNIGDFIEELDIDLVEAYELEAVDEACEQRLIRVDVMTVLEEKEEAVA